MDVMRKTGLSKVGTDFMGISEWGERIGKGYTTQIELAQRNELPVPVVKVGGKYLISRVAYKRWVERLGGGESDAA